ncbi:hypothetical protein [Spirosoma panaciterrae]|uniref:hypothetical protein n=1 Tax=Spirosoma panaciterrae TaxID=496058 RepID=UPI00036ABFDE|nr:hypothetical protein [Spirosoma panaciterrae]
MVSLSNQTIFQRWQPGKRLWLTLAVLIGWVPFAYAQTQVQVTINVMPPYSAYLQDYAGAGQQLQVIVRNLTMTALDVRLQGRVEGDNGVLIQTLPNFRPNRPLKLAPGETRILTRADLEGTFDLNQISVEGVSKDLLYQGKPLPEGNYQVCVQAYDNRTSQPLSSGFPLGCSPPFSVKSIEPPILISPFCDNDVLPTTPQATVFSWTPPAGILPTQVSYTLRVIELPLENVDPNVFIDAVALPPSGIEVKNLTSSTFLYGPQYLPLKVGKRYAWRVQAVDKFGKLNLLNDGKSPVCAFRYGTVADTLKTTPDLVNAKSPINVSGLAELIFCGQTITIKKITNPDRDHFSGTGTLVMKSPVKLAVDVNFANLSIRPLGYDKSQKRGNSGFYDFTVVNGKLESSLKGAQIGDKTVKLKTDKHTGGTAEIAYQAIRLVATHTEAFDEKLNAHTLQKGGTEESAIQTGVTWHSPIILTTMIGGGIKLGQGGVVSGGNVNTYDGNLVVDIPGEWHSIESVGNDLKKAPSLSIPFGKEYGGPMADLKDFFLTVKAGSYFEIQNGILKAHLKGSLKVPSGRKDTAPITIDFQDSDGITFTEQIEDPQVPLGVVDGQARVFLSFQAINVQLGDLFEASDLTYPQWVKGISCPSPNFWISKMIYMQDQDHPTAQDHLEWTTFPINPVVNRGKGYESTNGTQKNLNLQANYLGFKAKITDAVTIIKESEVKAGQLIGKVHIPFIGAVGDLQILVRKYGLGDADVFGFDKTERTLLQTPVGDRVVVSVSGGYFDGGFFYPDMSISAYNETNQTRGIDARDIRMDAIDVAITPKGELVSGYKSATAKALYGGSKQKTAYINGLDYHLSQVILGDETGGSKCRLSFMGQLVLGDKIISNEEYAYDIVFNKPKADSFEFIDAIPFPQGQLPGFGKPKGGGPSFDENEFLAEAATEATQLGYYLERSAPATFIHPTETKKIKGSYSTGTASFSGFFEYYIDDATYGNGFRLDHTMMVYSPVAALTQATIIAGKAQGVKYWFAGFKYESKESPGIPLFLNLEAYGFEGRLYSHMRHTGSATAIFDNNYVPDANTSFGLYAAMPIQSSGDKGRLLWGKTGVEITFKGYAPDTITIRGDVNIEQLGGTDDATTSRIQGNAVIVLTPKEKTLMGTVVMTKGDFGVACMKGSASFYMGPSGFSVSVGSDAQFITVQAMCGLMGDMTPSAKGYIALYATNGSIGGMDWIPTSGIGIQAHLKADLLNFNTKTYFDTNPWASLYAGADADLTATIRPEFDLKTKVGTQITLNVGYNNYSFKLAEVKETVQLTLPSFCLAYNKRICFPVLGGCNLIVGLSPTPYLRTNGSASDMCFDDGSVEGPCEGVLGWLMDGVQVVINAAGEVLDAAGNLIRNAAGEVVKGAKKMVKAAKDAYCSTIGWGC